MGRRGAASPARLRDARSPALVSVASARAAAGSARAGKADAPRQCGGADEGAPRGPQAGHKPDPSRLGLGSVRPPVQLGFLLQWELSSTGLPVPAALPYALLATTGALPPGFSARDGSAQYQTGMRPERCPSGPPPSAAWLRSKRSLRPIARQP